VERKREKREAEKSINREESGIKKAENEAAIAGLKNSKYALLKNKKDLNLVQAEKLSEVKAVSLVLKTMHELKEEFRQIFESGNNWFQGLISLGEWLSKAAQYFPKSHGTIVRWLDEVVAYFDNQTTSGVVEGINNKLKLIKRSAYGFRNFENFQARCWLSWHFNC
jgi:transposase